MSIRSELREKSGKNPESSAAMINTQSVKTSQVAESREFDGNKGVRSFQFTILQRRYPSIAALRI